MQRLRNAVFLARLVLAWFALSIGVAVASPAVKPQAIELICSASGAVKMMVHDADGTVQAMGHLLDCPLCASTAAPPPCIASLRHQAVPSSSPVQPPTSERIATRSSPPLPARGPPSTLSIQ